MAAGDFAQPLKPYLRYRDPKNRIIAMPAFVGGNVNMAGIKWIASFPDNIKSGLPRAHSVVILNNADTGEPVAIICTPLLSVIRTASVSGLMIRRYGERHSLNNIVVGITGFGPIGRYHVKMLRALLGDRIARFLVYDVHPPNKSVAAEVDPAIELVRRWEDAYLDADIFVTCTVSPTRYIDERPKRGSLHLNVSLRDYTPEVYEWFRESIIVDDWDEVCRENTDIEIMSVEKGLLKSHTRSIVDVVHHNCLEGYAEGLPIMFNPMGMSVFDIAMGAFYYGLSC
jgi:ornithine cyclodeaminase